MEQLLKQLIERIVPHDGMVVNAKTWAKAHDFHYNHQRAHLLLGHGAGIVSGLEVVVDSQGKRVWVQPGMAIDAQGQLIVLAKQEALAIGTEQTGLKYIYFEGAAEQKITPHSNSHSEGASEARAPGGIEPQGDPHLPSQTPATLKIGYRLVEGFTLPVGAVELARVRVTRPDEPLQAASDENQPRPHELDQRFRRHVGVSVPPMLGAAIVYLGQGIGPEDKYGRRAGQLAGTLSHLTRYRVWFDDDVNPADFAGYTLIYLVERGNFSPDRTLLAALQTHRARGGTILVDTDADDSPLLAHFNSQDTQFKPEPDESLLTDPFLFGRLPEGTDNAGQIWFADGLLISSRCYGPLWQRRPDYPREVIRSAVEWAANLVTYAVKRREGRRES